VHFGRGADETAGAFGGDSQGRKGAWNIRKRIVVECQCGTTELLRDSRQGRPVDGRRKAEAEGWRLRPQSFWQSTDATHHVARPVLCDSVLGRERFCDVSP